MGSLGPIGGSGSPYDPHLMSPVKFSWSSLVQGTSSSITQFNPNVEVTEGVTKVMFPDEIMVDTQPMWASFGLENFVGNAPHVDKVHAIVNCFWASFEKSSRIFV